MNGWLAHYGASSFKHQCEAVFGAQRGHVFYELVNNAFDSMPIAAVISDQVFCCHGGIPEASTYKDYGSIYEVAI
jgi:protein phosphatase